MASIKKFTSIAILVFVFLSWHYLSSKNVAQPHNGIGEQAAQNKMNSSIEVSSRTGNLVSNQDADAPKTSTSNQARQLEVKNLPDNEPLARYLSATQNAASLAEKIKNDPTLNLTKVAQATFDSESYTQDWAEPRRQNLQNSFHNNPELQNVNLKSIECKSKFCQIQIFYKDKSELEPVVQQLAMSSLNGSLKGLFAPSAQILYSEDGMTGIIYLSDDINAKLEP